MSECAPHGGASAGRLGGCLLRETAPTTALLEQRYFILPGSLQLRLLL